MPTVFSRRAFLRFAAATGAAVVLAACKPQVEVATPAKDEAAPAAATATPQSAATATPQPVATPTVASMEAVTVRWSYWANDALSKIYDQSVALFEEQNPGVKVEKLWSPGGTSEWQEKVLAMIAGSDVPDVLLEGPTHLTNFGGKGLLADLQPFIDADSLDIDDYFDAGVKGAQRDAKQVGMPIGLFVAPVFYNRAHFQEAGVDLLTNPDWTWEDLASIAGKLTREVDGVQRWGFHLSTWFDLLIAPRVWQNGGEILSDDESKCLLDQEPAMAAIQSYFDLRNEYQVAPDPTQMASIKELGAFYFAFMAGMVSMGSEGTWCPAGFNTTAGLDWDMQVNPIPSGGKHVSTAGQDSIAASAKSEHLAESWALVKFLTGKDAQQLRSESGNWCPVRKSVANDAKAQAGLGTNINFQAVFTEMDAARPIVSNAARWNDVDKFLTPALDLIFGGQNTAAEVLPEAVKQINDTLSKPPAE